MCSAIPKKLMFDAMAEIDKAAALAPVHRGDVIIPDLLGTGINVIATRDIE